MTKYQQPSVDTARPACKKPSSNTANTGKNNIGTATTRKRTHLKPAQLAALQASFMLNPLPDSSIRSKLAVQLGVTERTIQIWFQNRRAKARKMENVPFSAEVSPPATPLGMPMPPRLPQQARYQPTFRTMMTPELFEEQRQQQTPALSRRPRAASAASTPSAPHNLPQPELTAGQSARAMSEGNEHPVVSETLRASVNPIGSVLLCAEILRVGSWTRFARLASAAAAQSDEAWDLCCYGDVVERQLVWQIQAGGHRFAVQIPFDAIDTIRLGPAVANANGVLETTVEVAIHPHCLSNLTFMMQRPHVDHDWVRCGDFSEEKQASQVAIHVLQGQENLLRQSLFDLLVLTPDLAAKMQMVPTFASHPPVQEQSLQPPMLDLCRDFTLSPSATPTPEPYALPRTAPTMALPTHLGFEQPFLLDHTFTKSVPFPVAAPVTPSLPVTALYNDLASQHLMQYPPVVYGTQPLL